MEKLVMTQQHANEMMDDLALLFFCAVGAEIIFDEDGEPTFSDVDVQQGSAYARNKFCEICDELAEQMGGEWKVTAGDED